MLLEIGAKIKAARQNADLTQEQAAEYLGVTRQTISNWENEKTYPDIVSVVKMSSLYNVSLDHLLKEGAPEKGYLNYLEESTNTVKSKKKLSMIILISTYLGIWTISLAAFWLFSKGDALGHTIMFLYVVLPVTTLSVSFVIGRNDYCGKWKWVFTIILGIMYMLADYTTFSASNMIAFERFNVPQLEMIPAGAIFSFLGMGIGSCIHLLKTRRKHA